MTRFPKTIAAAGLMISVGSGAFAQDSDPSMMTCADFLAMDSAEQMAAVDMIHNDQPDDMASESSDAPSEADAATTTDGTASDTEMATEADGTEETEAAGDAEMATSDEAMVEMERLIEACENNVEALVMDQMAIL